MINMPLNVSMEMASILIKTVHFSEIPLKFVHFVGGRLKFFGIIIDLLIKDLSTPIGNGLLTYQSHVDDFK